MAGHGGVVGGRESEQGISQVKHHSPKLHNGRVCICSKKKKKKTETKEQ